MSGVAPWGLVQALPTVDQTSAGGWPAEFVIVDWGRWRVPRKSAALADFFIPLASAGMAAARRTQCEISRAFAPHFARARRVRRDVLARHPRDDPMKTIFFGASHTVYMAQCFGNYSAKWSDVIDGPVPITDDAGQCTGYLVLSSPRSKLFQPYLVDGRTHIRFNDRFSAPLAALDSPDNLCYLAIGGNEHNSAFMIQHAQPFDFHDDADPERFIAGRQIVPREAIAQRLAGVMSHIERDLNMVSALMPTIRKVFVCPPPPVPSAEQIRQFPEGFDLEGWVIEDRWVRLKIYRVYRSELARICARHGIELIGAPPECVDENGFLEAAYWKEATHAAPSYYRSIVRPH
jgi:hypothetical protein